MIKRNLIIFCLLISPFHLTACSSVSSKHIIGEPIRENLSKQFEGIWEFDEGIVYVKYLKEGELRIAFVEWVENKFKVEELTIILTECGDREFVNICASEIPERKESLFFYYSFITEETLAIWGPKIDAFEKSINEGKIKGEIKKTGQYTVEISINESKESLCNYLKKRDIEEHFDLEDPRLFRKINKLK